jgi:hypothetical protein
MAYRQNHVAVTLILPLAVAVLIPARAVRAQAPIVTTCTSGFIGADIVINKARPHDAFIASGAVVKHVSMVSPGSRSCRFGSILSDIVLGGDVTDSWGVALDRYGNLYVTAGPGIFATTSILRIAPPYTGTPAVFYSAATTLRSLAIHGHILYAADAGAGTILRFDLRVGPSSVRSFAAVPGAFGIFAADVDDLFVTSNAGFAGGSNDVKHVTRGGVQTLATGLSFPEGIGGDFGEGDDKDGNLYIAAAAVVFAVPAAGGTPSQYAADPILFSHGVTVWKGAGYVTDSHDSGEVHKFTLLEDDSGGDEI